jgi:Iron-sulfur cluster-binding domain
MFGTGLLSRWRTRATTGPSGRFCAYPFTFAEIHGNGDVYLCCPRWSGERAIGNVFRDTPEALWNSVQAQQIRAGIHDGTFSHCSHTLCPEIVARTLPHRDQMMSQFGEIISSGRTTLTKGPATVKLCHDETCNLYCPSCRDCMIVANRERQAQLDRMLHGFIVPFLADAQCLWLSGDGDPFASRHYREIMHETRSNPHLKINLHTNAVLCDERAWSDCSLAGRVQKVLVSIDAASADTYSVVRRGGDFDRLMRNLAFLSELRRAGEIQDFVIAFVVQAGNFKEMPAFVRLGQRLSVDSVFFSAIHHWSRGMTQAQFSEAQVWRSDHPLHEDFCSVLRDPALHDPITNLGDLAHILH